MPPLAELRQSFLRRLAAVLGGPDVWTAGWFMIPTVLLDVRRRVDRRLYRATLAER